MSNEKDLFSLPQEVVEGKQGRVRVLFNFQMSGLTIESENFEEKLEECKEQVFNLPSSIYYGAINGFDVIDFLGCEFYPMFQAEGMVKIVRSEVQHDGRYAYEDLFLDRCLDATVDSLTDYGGSSVEEILEIG